MKPDLLVLAAGMGSRFGGLKQMEPIGPSGEWLLDYSVRDAVAASFGRVVFVIREDMATVFRPMIEAKYGQQIEIAYAYQDLKDTPIELAVERSKPWGTGHAVYAARRQLRAPFAVINADDFYGTAAFEALGRFLGSASKDAPIAPCALVAYELANTLSEHGAVSRGICQVDETSALISVEEHQEIAADASGNIRGRNKAGQQVELPADTPVSLNCWGFPAGLADRLEPLFAEFLRQRGMEPKSEFHLPAAIDALVSSEQARVEALPCQSRWLGITHRDDLPAVREAVAELVRQGAYTSPLWQ